MKIRYIGEGRCKIICLILPTNKSFRLTEAKFLRNNCKQKLQKRERVITPCKIIETAMYVKTVKGMQF